MNRESISAGNPDHHVPASRGLAAWKIHLGLTLVLALLALLPPGTPRACVLGILAGASPALGLKKRWSVMELVGVSSALAMVFWPVAAVLASLSSTFSLLPWFPAFTALVLCGAEKTRASRLRFAFAPPDQAALAFTLILAVPVMMVALSNGPFVSRAGTPSYEARSWFSSDSFYLFSLAQSALELRTYPPENPFYPGAANLYPSLMHCGLAAIASLGSKVCAVDCWRFYPLFALGCAPLWVFSGLGRSGRNRFSNTAWLAAAGAVCLLVARPDFLVAIHSQAMALPVLFLIPWALGPPRGRTALPGYYLASLIALLLVFSHTVTAAVALVILGVEALRLSVRGKPWPDRIVATTIWVILAVVFLAVNRSGVIIAGTDGWSPRLATNLLRYHGPWVAPLTVIAFALGWPKGRRRGWHTLAVAGSAFLGLLYLAQGTRLADPVDSWFVLFNARRFWFFCLLVAIPGILLLPRRAAWASLFLVTLSLMLLPDDGRRDTLGLINGEPRIAGAPVQRVLEAVRKQTPPAARIHTNLGSWVAAFSGRPALVADPINLWAHGTVSSREFDLRIASHNALFDSPDASMRFSSLVRENCRFVVAYGKSAEELPFCDSDTGSTPPLCVHLLVKEAEISFGKIDVPK